MKLWPVWVALYEGKSLTQTDQDQYAFRAV
jgi:hypothetical protein